MIYIKQTVGKTTIIKIIKKTYPTNTVIGKAIMHAMPMKIKMLLIIMTKAKQITYISQIMIISPTCRKRGSENYFKVEIIPVLFEWIEIKCLRY